MLPGGKPIERYSHCYFLFLMAQHRRNFTCAVLFKVSIYVVRSSRCRVVVIVIVVVVVELVVVVTVVVVVEVGAVLAVVVIVVVVVV